MARREHAFRAEIVDKSAYLNSEFGIDLAQKKLGLSEQEIVEIVGRYTRGQRKGQIRGRVTWLKVEAGGWITGLGVVKPCSFGYALTNWEGEILFPEEYVAIQKFYCGDKGGTKEVEKAIFREWRLQQQKKRWDEFCEDHGVPVPTNYEVYARFLLYHDPSEELLQELTKQDNEFTEKNLKSRKESLCEDYFDVVKKILFYYRDITTEQPFVLPEEVLQQFKESDSVLCEIDKDPLPRLKPFIDQCRDRLIEFILDKELGIDPGLFNAENSKRYNELQQKKQKNGQTTSSIICRT
jgi:hypothetical protein